MWLSLSHLLVICAACWVPSLLGLLAILIGAGLGIYHAGVEWGN